MLRVNRNRWLLVSLFLFLTPALESAVPAGGPTDDFPVVPGGSRYEKVKQIESEELKSWVEPCEFEVKDKARGFFAQYENACHYHWKDGDKLKQGSAPVTVEMLKALLSGPVYRVHCAYKPRRNIAEPVSYEILNLVQDKLKQLCEAEVRKAVPSATGFWISSAPLAGVLLDLKAKPGSCNPRELHTPKELSIQEREEREEEEPQGFPQQGPPNGPAPA